jgi:hypothetical protein
MPVSQLICVSEKLCTATVTLSSGQKGKSTVITCTTYPPSGTLTMKFPLELLWALPTKARVVWSRINNMAFANGRVHGTPVPQTGTVGPSLTLPAMPGPKIGTTRCACAEVGSGVRVDCANAIAVKKAKPTVFANGRRALPQIEFATMFSSYKVWMHSAEAHLRGDSVSETCARGDGRKQHRRYEWFVRHERPLHDRR